MFSKWVTRTEDRSKRLERQMLLSRKPKCREKRKAVIVEVAKTQTFLNKGVKIKYE